MSVYKNIDGTSKKSFRIGAKGVVLSTDTIYADGPNSEAIKRLLVNDKAVFTEENKQDIFIERRYISKWTVNPDETECTFEMKFFSDVEDLEKEIKKGWNTETITLKTFNNQTSVSGVQIEGDATENNLVIFGSNGETIKDSGLKILSDTLNSKDAENEIPTFATLKQYVGEKEIPLSRRADGETAKIL